MLCAVFGCRPARPARILFFAFGSRVARVSQSKSLDRSARDLRCQNSRKRGVDAAAQEETDRNVRHQATLDTLSQQREQSLDELFFRRIRRLTLSREIDVPITTYLRLFAHLKFKHVRGRQHPNAFEDRVRAGYVFETQIMMQRFEIDASLETGHAQQRLDLRSKIKRVVV